MRPAALAIACLAVALTFAGPGGASPRPGLSFSSLTLTLPSSFSTPWKLEVADLDGLHGEDIVVMGSHGDFGVFLNNGDGTFQPAGIADSGCGQANSFATGQFSVGDSTVDLIVACTENALAGWHRLRGNGDGTFAAFDSTRDQLLDVQPHLGGGSDISRMSNHVFATQGAARSVVYTQLFGGATISTLQCFFEVSKVAQDLDEGASWIPNCSRDFDPSDNLIDIFTTGGWYTFAAPPFVWPEDAVFALDGNPDGSLTPGTLDALIYYPGGAQGSAGWNRTEYIPPAQVEDLPDPAAAGRFRNDEASPQILAFDPSLFALYDPGAGVEVEPGVWAIPYPTIVSTGDPDTGPFAYAPATADFDRDGNLDVAELAEDGGDGRMQIFRGHGDGSFAPVEAFPTRATPSSGETQMAVADLNGDSRPDVVNLSGYAPSGQPRYVTVLWNTTTGPPPPPPPPPPPAPPPPPPPVPPPPAARCVVPRVVGKTLAQAGTRLRSAHCRVGRVTRAYAKIVKKGRVIAQSRRPGARLPALTKVNLTVSRGRRPHH